MQSGFAMKNNIHAGLFIEKNSRSGWVVDCLKMAFSQKIGNIRSENQKILTCVDLWALDKNEK